MSNPRSLLVIGHSHIECLAAAFDAQSFDADVRFIKLRLLEQEDKDVPLLKRIREKVGDFAPDAICSCLGGNLHNVLGLIENPLPFCVGAGAVGAIPLDATSRAFIPNALMADVFDSNIRKHLTFAIYQAFPTAKRISMNAPPPAGEFSDIRKHPRIVRNKKGLKACPKDLRLHLYRIQTKTMQRFAERAEAQFVDIDSRLVDKHGFLASEFFGTDPTHGNSAYGTVMLHSLVREIGDME